MRLYRHASAVNTRQAARQSSVKLVPSGTVRNDLGRSRFIARNHWSKARGCRTPHTGFFHSHLYSYESEGEYIKRTG